MEIPTVFVDVIKNKPDVERWENEISIIFM